MSDVRQSPLIALMNTLAWQGQTGQQREALSDSIIKSAKDLVGGQDKPRLKKITVVLLEQNVPGELRYAIDAELKGIGLVRYGTEFMPEGRVLLRHLRQQQYLDTTLRI